MIAKFLKKDALKLEINNKNEKKYRSAAHNVEENSLKLSKLHQHFTLYIYPVYCYTKLP